MSGLRDLGDGFQDEVGFIMEGMEEKGDKWDKWDKRVKRVKKSQKKSHYKYKAQKGKGEIDI